jgi:HSP20 family protein
MAFESIAPRDSVNEFRQQMDRLLTGFIGDLSESWTGGQRRLPVNSWENEDSIFVELEVPGLSNDQIDVSVVNNELTVKINRPELQPEKEGEQIAYHRHERPIGTASRTLRLPVEVDAGKVSAELENGVLRIQLPKAEKAKSRKITIKSSD